MKYCSNCGQPLREGVKVCTNCGTPVQRFNQHHRHSQYSDQRRPYQQSVNKQSQSPKGNKNFGSS
ncbi:TcaA protein [Staphylococcus saccharolyticus]|uniref:TcaA protein n=1 Tax=Staphylococcus saccharolyticus TaxID=33028 RepID=A0A380H1G8_9STAP|nr:TcaA protein [Staphylococcus saccharolyticus]